MNYTAETYSNINPVVFYGGAAVVDYYGIDNDDYVNGEGFCCEPKAQAKNARSLPTENVDYEKLQYYYHSDHLGSASYITNLDGEVVQHIEYVPFGEVFLEERNNTWNTPFLFNGKELDEETGLYYYGARYYNPRISLWYGVDPLAEKYPAHSPYCYTINNPIMLVDPDGKAPVYDSEGNYRGNTKEGFTGNVLIYDGAIDFREMSFDMFDTEKGVSHLQSTNLGAEAYSKIYTSILTNEGYNMSPLENSMISVKSDGDSFNNPSEKVNFLLTSYVPGDTDFKISVNQDEQSTKELLTTVDNIVNLLGAHEYEGHGVSRFSNSRKTHYKAYGNQKDHRSWDNTTPYLKQSVNKLYSDYLRRENPREYRRKYEEILRDYEKYKNAEHWDR